MTIKGIPGSMAGTPEWLALRFYDPQRPFRKVVIGASRAAAALNQSRYSSAFELYLKLRREIPPEDVTEEMEYGLEVEPGHLRIYAKRLNLKIVAPQPMYFHPEHEFMAATPDALTEDHDRGVDTKASSWRMLDPSGEDPHKYGQEGTDQLPVEYIYQAQQQIEVLGVPFIDFPVFIDRKMRVYTVHREPTLIEAIIDAERELAQRVIDGKPPEPNWTSPKARELIRALHGLTANKVVTLSEECVERWSNVQKWNAEIKRLEEQVEAEKARIYWELQDAQSGRFPRGTVELHRSTVAESRYTQSDVDQIKARLGHVKRKGYEQLRERKVKS